MGHGLTSPTAIGMGRLQRSHIPGSPCVLDVPKPLDILRERVWAIESIAVYFVAHPEQVFRVAGATGRDRPCRTALDRIAGAACTAARSSPFHPRVVQCSRERIRPIIASPHEVRRRGPWSSALVWCRTPTTFRAVPSCSLPSLRSKWPTNDGTLRWRGVLLSMDNWRRRVGLRTLEIALRTCPRRTGLCGRFACKRRGALRHSGCVATTAAARPGRQELVPAASSTPAPSATTPVAGRRCIRARWRRARHATRL
jgi:hypothetical protein